MKICKVCNIKKSLKEFNKNKNKKDGLNYKCKQCEKEYMIQYRKNNQEKILLSAIKWKQKNPKKVKQMNHDWNNKNLNYKKQYMNNYCKEQYKNNIQYKLAHKIRSKLNSAIKSKNISKSLSNIKELGCTGDEFIKYIENLFVDKMNWENYGNNGWTIDHIIPLSAFDLTNKHDYNKANHYTNIQPLWFIDNIKKSNKYNVNKGVK